MTKPGEEGLSRAEAARRGRLFRLQRRKRVLYLRTKHGWTNQEIADQVSREAAAEGQPGVTAGGVEKIINNELGRHALEDPKAVESLRSEQTQRIKELIGALWAKARNGNMAAVDRILAAERTLARIAGTEAPQKHEHSGFVAHGILTDGEAEEVARLEEAFKTSSLPADVEGHADDVTPALPSPAEGTVPRHGQDPQAGR